MLFTAASCNFPEGASHEPVKGFELVQPRNGFGVDCGFSKRFTILSDTDALQNTSWYWHDSETGHAVSR